MVEHPNLSRPNASLRPDVTPCTVYTCHDLNHNSQIQREGSRGADGPPAPGVGERAQLGAADRRADQHRHRVEGDAGAAAARIQGNHRSTFDFGNNLDQLNRFNRLIETKG